MLRDSTAAWKSLCALAPARGAPRPVAAEQVRQADELVGQHAAAAQPGVAVVEIADRDRRAGADVVVDLLFEEPRRAGVRVSLQVAADPVDAVAEAVRKQPATSS